MPESLPATVLMPVRVTAELVIRVPFRLFQPYETRCQANHGGQTLARIRERGGFDLAEAVAVLLDRPLEVQVDRAKDLQALVEAWAADELIRLQTRRPPSAAAVENELDALFTALRACISPADQVTGSIARAMQLRAAGLTPTHGLTMTIHVNGGAGRNTI